MAYNEIILTDHAVERMVIRRVSKKMVMEAITKSDSSKKESDGDTQFIKKIKNRPLHVVAKPLPAEKKWLIKTVWVNGEDDPNPIIKFILTIGVKLFRETLVK